MHGHNNIALTPHSLNKAHGRDRQKEDRNFQQMALMSQKAATANLNQRHHTQTASRSQKHCFNQDISHNPTPKNAPTTTSYLRTHTSNLNKNNSTPPYRALHLDKHSELFSLTLNPFTASEIQEIYKHSHCN